MIYRTGVLSLKKLEIEFTVVPSSKYVLNISLFVIVIEMVNLFKNLK